MTLPNERLNAIKNTREFLRSLLDPKKTPRIPKDIRNQAYRCLRHYPADFYLAEVLNDQHHGDIIVDVNTVILKKKVRQKK